MVKSAAFIHISYPPLSSEEDGSNNMAVLQNIVSWQSQIDQYNFRGKFVW
jgi:hypothetical protein